MTPAALNLPAPKSAPSRPISKMLPGPKPLKTGANSGIGEPTVIALRQRAADVVIDYVKDDEAEACGDRRPYNSDGRSG